MKFKGKNKDIPDWGQLLLFIDAILIVACASFWFHYVYAIEDINLLYVLAITILLTSGLLLSNMFGVYYYWIEPSITREIKAIFYAWFAVVAIMTIIAYMFKLGPTFSRTWFSLTITSILLLACLSRLLFRALMNNIKGNKWNHQNILIIGTLKDSQILADTIKAQHWVGLKVAKCIEYNQSGHDLSTGQNKAKSTSQIELYLEQCNRAKNQPNNHISQVWILLEDLKTTSIQKLQSVLSLYSVETVFVPNLSLITKDQYKFLYRAGIPVIIPDVSTLTASQHLIKACEDYILATIILLCVMPLMLLIAIGVKLSSPGPIFYIQKRVTLHGQQFRMLKFRSMPVNTEAHSGPVWANADENRATKFGKFLRHSSLDELPQFINVLKGEMSIVGPRPERPEFVEQFKKEIPGYMKKHLLKAGITGWAQVQGFRGNTSLSKRVEHDIHYINHWSLTFDLRIMLMTLYKGFINKSAY